jgi:hypothetical protein
MHQHAGAAVAAHHAGIARFALVRDASRSNTEPKGSCHASQCQMSKFQPR